MSMHTHEIVQVFTVGNDNQEVKVQSCKYSVAIIHLSMDEKSHPESNLD